MTARKTRRRREPKQHLVKAGALQVGDTLLRRGEHGPPRREVVDKIEVRTDGWPEGNGYVNVLIAGKRDRSMFFRERSTVEIER